MKRFALCSLFFVLCSCGFAPMYSDNTQLQSELSDIYIAPIAGTNGIDLRNYLIMNWNTDNNPDAKYKLTVKLGEPTTIYKGLQRSGDATWDEVRVRASWTLSDGKKTIMTSTDSASESYTFVSDLVSANASKNSSIQNAVKSIGEKIGMKVGAKLKNID